MEGVERPRSIQNLHLNKFHGSLLYPYFHKMSTVSFFHIIIFIIIIIIIIIVIYNCFEENFNILGGMSAIFVLSLRLFEQDDFVVLR